MRLPKSTWPCLVLLLAAVPTGAQVPDDCSEGLTLYHQGERAAAEPLLAGCAAQGVAVADVLLALADITHDDGRTWDSLDWSQRAVESAPESAEARFCLGRALLATGDREAALAQWSQGLALDAEHAGLLRAMAALQLEEGREQAAYGLLSQLARIGGADRWTFRTLSDLAGARGLWGPALSHWRALLACSAPEAADYRHAGELAILAGDTAYAVTVTRTALEREPGAASAAAFGEACFAARRFAQAEQALRDALAAEPARHDARFHLANVLELQGRLDEAGVEFSAYVRARPEDPHGFHNFAVHLDNLGLTETALTAAERAAALAPRDVQLRIHVAELHEKRSDLPAALAGVESLLTDGAEPRDRLLLWRDRLAAELAEADAPENAGKLRLLHVALPDGAALAAFQDNLRAGMDFAALATRYSVGRNAATGGDLGWVAPGDLVGDLGAAVAGLQEREISPPVTAEGLIHIFKRIR